MSFGNADSIAPPCEGARRVIFLNRFYAPDQSATAQLLTDLAEHLAGRGWHVEIITSQLFYGDASTRLPSRASMNGVTIHRIWTLSGLHFGLVGRLLAYLTFYMSAGVALARRARAGTIVVAKTDPPLIGVVALAVTRLRGARLVNWVQDLYPEVAVQAGVTFVHGPLTAILTYLRDMSLRRAALTVTIGRRMTARIVARGVPEDRVATIANWSDDEAIRPTESHSPALREDWGLPLDAFVLEYSGHLGRAHEVDTLLAAAAMLVERRDIWFLFIGGGHAQSELSRKVAKAGCERFVFRPHQPRAALSTSLAIGDAHWLSLRPEFEGLIVPSKVFGIAAIARPIVAVCDLGGEIPSMISSYGAGIAVAPGDAAGLAAAIVALADDRVECCAMGERARAMLQQGFRRSFALEQWESRLESLVSGD